MWNSPQDFHCLKPLPALTVAAILALDKDLRAFAAAIPSLKMMSHTRASSCPKAFGAVLLGTLVALASLATLVWMAGQPGVRALEPRRLEGDGTALSNRLSKAAGLRVRMPVWLQFVASCVKPFVFALIFGPPRPGKEEAWHKPIQILVFVIVPAIWAFKADVVLIMGIVTSKSLTLWQQANAIFMVAGSSSNASSCGCLVGSQGLVADSMAFLKLHEDPTSSREERRDHWETKVGWVTRATMQWNEIYAFFGVGPLFILILPALVAYCYISIPFLFVTFAIAGLCANMMRMVMSWWFHSEAEHRIQETTLEAQQAWEQAWSFTDGRYSRDKACYDETGSTNGGLGNYFTLSVLPAILPISTAAMARLVTGCGYWVALQDSWEDRHWRTWVSYLLDSGVDALGDAQNLTHGGVDDYITLLQRWLVAANSFV
ncbi:unnamed protein product [Symbiodinium microadriaticum]|nr:unnamed protein product [Symbiodinium microadriaticum]